MKHGIVTLLLASTLALPTALPTAVDDAEDWVFCNVEAIQDMTHDIRVPSDPLDALEIQAEGPTPVTGWDCALNSEGGVGCQTEGHTVTHPNGAVDEYRTTKCVYADGEPFYTCEVHNHYNDPDSKPYTTMVPPGCAS